MQSTDATGAIRIMRPLNLTELVEAAVALVVINFPRILLVLFVTNLPLLLWQALAIWSPGNWIVPSRYRAGFDAFAALELVSGVMSSRRVDIRLVIAFAVTLFSSLLQTATLTSLLAAWYRNSPLTIAATLENTLRQTSTPPAHLPASRAGHARVPPGFMGAPGVPPSLPGCCF